MKRFMGIVLLVVLQLGTAVGWLAYGVSKSTAGGEDWRLRLELTADSRQMQENLAMWYNLNLKGSGEGQPLDGYGQILYFEDGLMCGIAFPQEQKMLPVWHGARERKDGGLTHLSQSAFPVGGMGNHTVFSCREADLDGMEVPEKGESFVVYALEEVHVYRVLDVEITKREPAVPEGAPGKELCSIWIRRDNDWVIIRGIREDPQGQKGKIIG